MSNTVKHTIGDTTYEVTPYVTSEKIIVANTYVGQAFTADIEVRFTKNWISVLKNCSNGHVLSIITQIGDSIKCVSKGTITSEDDHVQGFDETLIYKNSEEFRNKQPRIASAVKNALAAINGASEKLPLSGAQKEMVRAYTQSYSKKEIAY